MCTSSFCPRSATDLGNGNIFRLTDSFLSLPSFVGKGQRKSCQLQARQAGIMTIKRTEKTLLFCLSNCVDRGRSVCRRLCARLPDESNEGKAVCSPTIAADNWIAEASNIRLAIGSLAGELAIEPKRALCVARKRIMQSGAFCSAMRRRLIEGGSQERGGFFGETPCNCFRGRAERKNVSVNSRQIS